MKRRLFLKYGLSSLAAPMFLNGQALGVITDNLFLKSLTSHNKTRKLVLIQMNGGNDGLNMFVPLNQYSNLQKARPNIIIPENKLLNLTDTIGLHPAMENFKITYDEEQALIVQNVGYPNPNLSHFRSKDIINSGSASDVMLNSGWLGRYLQKLYPSYPEDFPNEVNPHPIAVTIGATSSPNCQGEGSNLSIVMKNLNVNFQQTGGGVGQEQFPDTPYGHELQFINEAMQSTEAYLDTVQEAASKAKNLSPLYPEKGNNLASQLAIVAKLIAGGLETQIYIVSIGGFDLHAKQIQGQGEEEQGKHALLLGNLSEGIRAFQDDLRLMGKDDEVIGLAYTEFGRRIASNDGLGTDHGEAYPAILFGKQINSTVLGDNPIIPDEVGPKQNVKMKIDFRSIYASIFHKWFEADKTTVREILYDDFTILPILKNATSINSNDMSEKVQVYPNPVSNYLNVEVDLQNPDLEISLFNQKGQKIKTFMNKKLQATYHKIQLPVREFPAGSYILQITSGDETVSKKIMIKD